MEKRSILGAAVSGLHVSPAEGAVGEPPVPGPWQAGEPIDDGMKPEVEGVAVVVRGTCVELVRNTGRHPRMIREAGDAVRLAALTAVEAVRDGFAAVVAVAAVAAVGACRLEAGALNFEEMLHNDMGRSLRRFHLVHFELAEGQVEGVGHHGEHLLIGDLGHVMAAAAEEQQHEAQWEEKQL